MSRWLTRWHAALRIARRDALRNKGRTALVVLLMMLPVAAGTFGVGVLKSSRPTTETTISWELGSTAQARLTMACDGRRSPTMQDVSGMPVCGTSDKDLGELSETELARAVPVGSDVQRAGQGSLPLRSDEALIDHAEVIQVDAQDVPGLLGETSSEAAPGEGEMVLREGVAERLGATVGDQVELMVGDEPKPVQVVGIGHSTTDTAALLGPGTLPEGAVEPVWFLTGDVPVTWEDVVALNDFGLVVISRAVLLDPPAPDRVYGGQFAAASGIDVRSVGYVLAVGGLVLLEIILLIGPAFAVGARRSARSLALVGASGGEPADLRRIVLAGGVVTGVFAAGAGVLIGMTGFVILYIFLSQSQSPPPNLVIPVWESVAIGLIALMLGVAAAWLPARAASRADVVTVLAGRRAEAPARRRVAWIGLGLGAVGLALAIIAAAISRPVLLAAGAITLEIGLVIAAGFLVMFAGRLAPHFGVAGRFALRDAQRHRSRTTPAVAAVLAVVAVATAGLVWVASFAQTQEVVWKPVAADGTGLLSLNNWNTPPTELTKQYQQASDVLASALPDAQIEKVRALTRADPTVRTSANALQDPQTVCPDPASYGPDAEDERCRSRGTISAGFTWTAGKLVDDGTMVGTLGLKDADGAAQALADGDAVTNDPDLIWPDGNIHLTLTGNEGEPVTDEILIPGHLVDWASWQYQVVLPPAAAEQFIQANSDWVSTQSDLDPQAAKYDVVPVGATVTGVELTQAVVDQVNRQLSEIDTNVRFSVQGRLHDQDTATEMLILIGLALFVALAATGLSVGLAVADSRSDLAALAAVGASPRTRRRITAAQAGVIAGIGTVAGVVTGLLLGYVLGLWQSADQNYGSTWQAVVPWWHIVLLLVALPLLAAAAGWLFTRSRLPAVRRMAS